MIFLILSKITINISRLGKMIIDMIIYDHSLGDSVVMIENLFSTQNFN